MNYIGFSTFDSANGDGMRVSLFVSGCTLHCKGCFNRESWDFKAGKPFTEDTMNALLTALEEPFISGLSILGGDPLEEQNIQTVYEIVRNVRQKFGKTKTIWLWSGRKYEKAREHPIAARIFKMIDVLVDGPFIEHLKVKNQWFGSSNQRIIYLHER